MDEEHCGMASFVLAPGPDAVALEAELEIATEKTVKTAATEGQDHKHGLTLEHFRLLAAKAGVTALGRNSYEELRRITVFFMETCIHQMVADANHRGSNKLQLLDVIRIKGPTLFGTGRLGEQLLRSIRTLDDAGASAGTDAVKAQAIFETDAAEARKETARLLYGDGKDEGDAGWISETAVLVQKDRAAKEALRREQDEGNRVYSPREQLLRVALPTETDQCSCRAYSLRLIQAMQSDTKPVIPYLPFWRLADQVSQKFMTDMVWAPELVYAFNAVVEHYLVGLLEDAHLQAIHRSSLTVQPKDLWSAQRIRREQA